MISLNLFYCWLVGQNVNKCNNVYFWLLGQNVMTNVYHLLYYYRNLQIELQSTKYLFLKSYYVVTKLVIFMLQDTLYKYPILTTSKVWKTLSNIIQKFQKKDMAASKATFFIIFVLFFSCYPLSIYIACVD